MGRPDLERIGADGYRVACYYRPDLSAPIEAVVLVTCAGRAVDSRTVPAARGLEVWRHAGLALPRYAAELSGAPIPVSDIVQRIAEYA